MAHTPHRATRATHRTAPQFLENTRPFNNGNDSMSAIVGVLRETGELPEPYATQYREDLPYITYTVLSFITPIGWVVEKNGHSTTVIPDVKYSTTTSKHQYLCRNHLPFQR